jgi:hypothetical protein
MPQTHNLGRDRFWHKVRLQPDAPRHHLYPTLEYEHPYRRSLAHVIRIFRHWGITVGRWTGDPDGVEEETQLFEAVKGGPLAEFHFEKDPELGKHNTRMTFRGGESIDAIQDRVRYHGWTVR